jgi:LuxR family glucitol operon transcriptional activator
VRGFALDDALGQVVQMSLMDASDELNAAKRRYSVHPLTRAFALARLQENSEFERGARERAARYFIQFAQANQVTQSQRGGAVFLQAELSNLFETADWCYIGGLWGKFTELVEAMFQFLWMYGYYDDLTRLGVVQVAATELDNPRLAAKWAVWVLGWIYCQQEASDDAEFWIRKGLRIFEQLRDERAIAGAERQLAVVFRGRGNYEEAERLLNRALATFERMEDPIVDVPTTDDAPSWWRSRGGQIDVADTLRSLGGLAYHNYHKGNYGVARDYYEKSLAILKAAGDEEGIAHSSYHLGMVALKTGQLEEAQELLQITLAGAEKAQWIDMKAHAQQGIAYLMEIRGEYEPALTLAREALATHERLGMQRYSGEARALIERLEARLTTR